MSPKAVEVSQLAKSFGKSVRALDGIDFEVEEGTVFGLLGPNGAGKTTAVRILTTVLKPDSGFARVLGHDVAKEPATVRSSIGLAGQFAAIDENLTGAENLRMIGQLTGLKRTTAVARAKELLEQFELADAASRPSKTYSGGMKRRLDLAAALVHRPPMLFLDEPTTGLDPFSRISLWEVIENLVSAGTTVLLTTQYLEEADRLASTVAVVDHGKIIANGTPKELKANLGGTIMEMEMENVALATKCAGILRDGYQLGLRISGTQVELPLEDGPNQIRQVLELLGRAGISPKHLTLREPSLDDVFLTLTGHRAELDEETKERAL